MENNENFEFFDFPINTEIEIPDEDPASKKTPFGDPSQFMKELSGMTPDKLMKMLPPDAKEQLEQIAKMTGMDLNTMLSQSIMLTQNLNNGNMNAIMAMLDDIADDDYCDEDCEDCPDCEAETDHYELADIKHLQPQYFGSVECYEDDYLYEHFVDKYGSDSTKYLDSNIGVKESYLTEITAELPLGNIKNLKFIEATNRYVLFFAEPDLPNVYGFFVAIIKTENDFALYIPEFRNTFNISADGKVSLYNPEEHPGLFNIDENTGTAAFTDIIIPAIDFSINFALAPVKRTLITPHQFGTIKNTLPPISGDSMFLKVGTITSNESSEAVLLKKDAELNLNEKTFDFYFNFNRVVRKDSLDEVAQILFKTDFNNAKILDNLELKYTADKTLYVDIDFGEF